nr:hypothetical protein [Tanacetum cinerariifolium]
MCYNCKGEGHMSKQCTKPKKKRDAEWFKDKISLMENLSHFGSDNLTEESVLKEQQNDNKASVSYEQSLEIKTLKYILSDNLKEKESLEQKITLLKNDFQKEESRNI